MSSVLQDHYTVHVGLLQVEFFIPESHSLKEKRMVLRSLTQRIKNKFNVSVCELDSEDKWQRAALAVVMASSNQKFIDRALAHVVEFIQTYDRLDVVRHQVDFI